MSVQSKFADARKVLKSTLIERDDEIDVVLTALIAGEHPLLVGPPGTAKSLLLDSLMSWMDPNNHVKKFNILLTKYTTPEEVFGPISVMGLKQDRFVRVTTERLPEAHVAFMDEIFKASSAVLNTMLRILNERRYDNGGVSINVPLQLAVAASNEWPNEENGGRELGALFDRFLFRKAVSPIRTVSGRNKLLWEPNLTPQFKDHITLQELEQAKKEASSFQWSTAAQEGFHQIIQELNKEGIAPGDRRLRKSVHAVEAYAYLDGQSVASGNDSIEIEHLDILAHTLWEDPTEQPKKTAQIVAKIANPSKMAVREKMVIADDLVAKSNNAVQTTQKLQELLSDVKKMSKTKDQEVGVRYIDKLIKAEFKKVMGNLGDE